MKNIKVHAKSFSYYFVDFFMSVLAGLGITLLFDIPIKLIQELNTNLGHFVIHFIGMCVILYFRSYRRSYHVNSYTYTFQFKKVLLFVGMVFVSQVLLVLILGVKNGGHAVYIAGPSRWLATYVLSVYDTTEISQYTMYRQLNWLFMILLDVIVYAPIMILGEYWGYKKHSTETATAKTNER